MTTHLEPDILDCEVKWALGSITTNKASRGDGIPVELFQIQPVYLKELSPEYSLERLMLELKLQYSGHLMGRTDSSENTLMLGESEGKRRGQQSMRWLGGIIHSVDMNLSKLQETVKDWGAWHAAAHGVAKSQIQLSN